MQEDYQTGQEGWKSAGSDSEACKKWKMEDSNDCVPHSKTEAHRFLIRLLCLIIASQGCEIAQTAEHAWSEGGQVVETEVSAGGEAYAVSQVCIMVAMQQAGLQLTQEVYWPKHSVRERVELV